MNVEEGLLLDEELPADHRSGFVALLGKPNVGKSTLLNAWLGFTIVAVSPKPQTTRNRLLGILTRPDAQAVFVDTPGIHLPRNKLGDYMVSEAKRAIPDADLLLFVVDVSQMPNRADREIARLIHQRSRAPALLVLNKTDLVSTKKFETRRAAYQALGPFDAAMGVSALRGDNRDALLEAVVARLPFGPRYYPEDQVTDQQERFIASELIREQLMRLLEHEVPYALAVVVQEFRERANGLIYISANIYTEKDSQKGIVIGHKGSMLKSVGRQAREALERFFERRVYLELWVKVRKNWRRDARYLRQLGYALPDRNKVG